MIIYWYFNSDFILIGPIPTANLVYCNSVPRSGCLIIKKNNVSQKLRSLLCINRNSPELYPCIPLTLKIEKDTSDAFNLEGRKNILF